MKCRQCRNNKGLKHLKTYGHIFKIEETRNSFTRRKMERAIERAISRAKRKGMPIDFLAGIEEGGKACLLVRK